MSSEYYSKTFYEKLRTGARESAEAIIPLVLQLLSVRSVVDVGCGDGSWLSVFRKLGVKDILGIDGDYVDRDLLQIPRDCFQPVDLAKPYSLSRVYDLAISLEVAEHLPSACAPVFVESLTRVAPAVLFSAAIPLQGGSHHINEQWPDYWAGLFKEQGFLPVDFVRKRVWQNDVVNWWYAQNVILFAREDVLESNVALKAESAQSHPGQLCLVHPRNYLEVVMPVRPVVSGVKEATQILLDCVRNAWKKRLYSITRRGTGPEGKSKSYKPVG